MKETNADIISGSRYQLRGGVEGWPLIRKIISRVANFITNQLFQSDYSDLTGSFRMYKKTILLELLKKIKSTGYSFQV